MDKNAIKKFAVWARRELISRVSQKALQYGIAEDNIVPATAASVNGVVLSDEEVKQRRALIEQISSKGYEQVMEEVAYTWFNRFIALRFMEVNGYLPSHVRVFTDEDNNFKPQILAEAINLELDGLDMERVYALKDANDNDALFQYLIIVQCNALNPILPGMFQKIDDYTVLLFPDNLLREGSAIQQMIERIPEEDWKDAVQIIGWLYQYYNSEKKDEVFAALKKNVKITKENIPAATQLFTPDWIVRYMVENSLGRLWLEGHPDAKDQLLPTQDEQSAYAAGNRDPEDTKWHYYLEEAEQEPDVQAQLAQIRKEYAALPPEQIKVIDPCCGSGHILAYTFDVLMQIYEVYGYSVREAVRSIVENNIYGLDIDDRAAQLAYFAVMMKARQYDRRFLTRKDEDDNPDIPQPHIYAIVESNDIDSYALDYFTNGDPKLKTAMDCIIKEMRDAKEYGSILNITHVDFSALYARFDEVCDDISISREIVLSNLLQLVHVAELLSSKYDAVITNPPYMGGKSMTSKLSSYVRDCYPNSKSDLFAVLIERCSFMTACSGFYAMITQPSLLTLLSFEHLRSQMIHSQTINSLIHFGRGIFGIDFGSTSFVVRKKYIAKYRSEFYRPHERTFQYIDPYDIRDLFLAAVADHSFCYDFSSYNSDEEPDCEAIESKMTQIHYSAQPSRFSDIPTVPFAYWISDEMYSAFENVLPLSEYAEPKQGMATADNGRFLRYWQEVSVDNIGFSCATAEYAKVTGCKWFPYNKGGVYRKWYGNNEYVVNWKNDGMEIKNFAGSVIRNPSYYFREGLTWGSLSAGPVSFRYSPEGFLFDSKGPVCFAKDGVSEKYVLALVNSVVAKQFLKILAPTMDYNQGPIGRIPFAISEPLTPKIETLTKKCLELSKSDWDDFESSWDFHGHPMITVIPKGGSSFEVGRILLSECYGFWEAECNERFNQLKSNEEELNRIFIDIYGFQNELTPEVEDKDVTVHKADLGRDIRSFISYAVGCMFGRYSLDEPGLAYAGGVWDDGKCKTFPADKDNIIPICDDEYFKDDIVGRFVKFVETVYGAETLDENLKFIADALGGKGQPKDVIRSYFMNEFFNDHCRIYQKRPIYWLFDSGKKGGFRALVYMHRYQPDTIARMRTDYVHEQQARYRTAIADLEQRIASASTSERVKLSKRLKTLQDQAAEIQGYEEKIHHLADQYISIDLDDGVKKNYEIFKNVLAKIK